MPIRRFRIPSTLVITTLALPACGTAPNPTDAGGNDAPADTSANDGSGSDALNCVEFCRTYDQTSCSSTCQYVAGDGGTVGCTGDPNCAPLSSPACCCCLVA